MNSENFTREEMVLISTFRKLPVEQQFDLLSVAEDSLRSFERMRELTHRQTERRVEAENSPWN